MAKAEQMVLFDRRFLATYAGNAVLNDPRTALVELVANSWDAGSTNIEIDWPNRDRQVPFRISDNGIGMLEEEFKRRWITLSYDRIEEQGEFVVIQGDKAKKKRKVYGRNGVGRYAGFCFGEKYVVKTWKEGKEVTFRVSKGTSTPTKIEKINERKRSGSGTEILAEDPRFPHMTEEEARAEISMRFLIDPSFKVKLSNIDVHFKDIPLNNVEKHTVEIADIGAATLYIIDLKDTDRTTHQHGIAWHVNGRLVGDCSWKGTEHESFLDGRRVEAKRYTFIIFADFLSDVVSKDWTGFNTKNAKYQAANSKIQEFIRERLLEFSKGKREETLFTVKSAYKKELREMTMRSKEKWNAFVEEVQEKCPSIGEKDLVKLAGVLANLELAKSKFNLLHQLHQLDHSNIDELNKVLEEWKIENVKIVLDELQQRMRILDELKIKVASTDTDEVQELQPLFHRGLWIFGPEYETIEYTSNRGMTKVVQDLFKSKKSGTRLRPDFVVLPDSSVGLYSYPTYDSEGGEIGVAKVVVIELKKPGIEIGSEEKNQCWKYIVELYSKGLLQSFTKVDCFALGSRVSPIDGNIRTEKDQAVRIIPLGYDIVIERAKSRLLKLYDRVASAPFLANAKIEPLIKVDEVDADDLQVDFSKEKSFA